MEWGTIIWVISILVAFIAGGLATLGIILVNSPASERQDVTPEPILRNQEHKV